MKLADTVIEERPVAFELNGIAHVVMLATPDDLEDFALGFLLTEGLIDSRTDLLDVEAEPRDGGIVLALRISARCEARFKEQRRNLAGRTGCGLCGAQSLAQVLRPLPSRVAAVTVNAAALQRAAQALIAHQPLQRATGAAHAAAWCALDGTPRLVREDVGRHNALDKLVGAMQKANVDTAQGFILVTSRASYEMVQKTARAGVGLLAAVSAPTTLAVSLAKEAGITLAGFVRDGRATVYSGAEHIID